MDSHTTELVPPVDVQLAVQGGGARLCGLLAALEAAQTLERKGVLRVTRVAGTSAGAIAAALYAAGVDFDKLRQRIIDNRAKLERFVPRPSILRFAKAVAGRPMVDLGPIRAALAEVFQQQNVSRFADLRIPLVVIATDLTNGRAHSYEHGEQDVVNAVLDSCAIPFYFRGPGSRNGSALFVDGGVCENFPVDVLRRFEDESGRVIGITFRPAKPGVTPSGVLEFSMALLDAAMENSVRRAQRQLGPERMLSLKGDIGTLEFPRALGEGMGDRYELTRKEAEEFFRGVIAQVSSDSAAPPSKPTVTVEAGRDEVDSIATLQAHADLYAAQHANVLMDYREARMLVRSGGFVAGSSRPDTLSYRLRFGASKVALECIRVVVVEEQGLDFLQTLRTEVFDKNFRRRPTIDLRARDRRAPTNRAYLLFFDPTIHPDDPDGPFTLQYTHQIAGLFNQLITTGSDTLSFETTRAEGITPRVTLVAVLPRTHEGYGMRASPDTTSSDKGRRMSLPELQQLEQELVVDPDQYVVGWVGTNIEPGREFAVELHAPGH